MQANRRALPLATLLALAGCSFSPPGAPPSAGDSAIDGGALADADPLDASPPDAGRHDAGRHDAGAADAELGDDGGSHDAGDDDGGPPADGGDDAGPSDAGTPPGICGDGHIDVELGEACDDGNTSGGDGCSGACLVEDGWVCTGEPSACIRWFNTRWTRRIRIFVDNAEHQEELLEVPVPVFLDPSRFDYGAANSGGDDLRFITPDGQLHLHHEIERWSQNGSSVIWVQLPRIPRASEGPAHFALYYGASNVSPQANREHVWGTSHLGVWHLNEGEDDSTTYRRHGSSTNLSSVTGIIARARQFQNGSYVEVPDPAVFELTPNFTVSFWMHTAAWQRDYEALIVKGDVSWRVHRRYRDRNLSFDTNGLTPAELRGTAAVDDGQWHHIAAVYDGAEKRLYVDGELDAAAAVTGTPWTDGQRLRFGQNRNISNRHYRGQLDEVRISQVARSALWIATEHRAGRDQLLRLEPTETRP